MRVGAGRWTCGSGADAELSGGEEQAGPSAGPRGKGAGPGERDGPREGEKVFGPSGEGWAGALGGPVWAAVRH